MERSSPQHFDEELGRRIRRIESQLADLRSSALVRIADHHHDESQIEAASAPSMTSEGSTGDSESNLTLTTGANENRVFIDALWDEVGTAKSYEVELLTPNVVDETSGPDGETTVTTENVIVQRTATENNRVRFEPVEPVTDYIVRVRVIYSNISAPADYLEGTITTGKDETVPAQVTGLSVGAGYKTITATWDEVPDADVRDGNGQYEIDIATDTGFTTGLRSQRVGGTVASFGDLTAGEALYVRVRAVDSSGNPGPYSATETATPGDVVAPDPDPSDGNPPASSPTPTVTAGIGFLVAEWEPVANADPVTYHVHVSTTNGFTPNAGTKHGEISGTTYFIHSTAGGNPLAAGTVYYVKVVATDADGSATPSAQGSGTPVQDPLFEIGTGSILEQHLADAAVASAKLKDAAVTSVKIENLAVTKAKVYDDVTNLINNPTKTGTAADWTITGSGGTLTAVTEDFNGMPITALRARGAASHQVYSRYFDVDTSKTYEFRIWVKDTALVSGAQLYFGLNALKADSSTAAVIPVNFTTGAVGTPSTNPYFGSWSNPPVGEWIEVVGYVFPYGTDPTTVRELGKRPAGSSGSLNFIFTEDVRRLRMRFLNWNNTGTERDVFAANVVVREVGIAANSIAANIVDTKHLVAGAVVTDKLAAGAVTAEKITANWLVGGKLVIGGTTADFDANYDPTTKATPADVDAAVQPANDRITLWEHTGTTFIDGGQIFADSITANQIAAGAIGADEIEANSITAAKMVTGTITAASGILADAVITTAKIADLAVNTAKIANLNVTAAKIADLNVTTAKIANLNVTEGKIANLAVTTAKVQDAAIVNAKIGNLAVDSAKIADAAITTVKIGDAQITNAKITSLAANKLTTDTLTATTVTLGTGGVFRAGNTTDGLYFDSGGIRMYKGGAITVDLPVAGDPTFSGTVTGGHIRTAASGRRITLGNISGLPSNEIQFWNIDNYLKAKILIREEVMEGTVKDNFFEIVGQPLSPGEVPDTPNEFKIRDFDQVTIQSKSQVAVFPGGDLGEVNRELVVYGKIRSDTARDITSGGRFVAEAGAATAPVIIMGGGNGFSFDGTNGIQFSTGSTLRGYINSSAMHATRFTSLADGTQTSPAFRFLNNPASGMYNASGNVFITAGTTWNFGTASYGMVLQGDLRAGSTAALPAVDGVAGSSFSDSGYISCARGSAASLYVGRNGSNGTAAAFYRSGTLVGTISVTTTATAYNTSSDYRLKESITPIESASSIIKQLKPYKGRYKATPNAESHFFLAHEVQEVLPEVVTGEKDAVDEEGNPVLQMMDHSKLVPLITAHLLELEERLATVENRGPR